MLFFCLVGTGVVDAGLGFLNMQENDFAQCASMLCLHARCLRNSISNLTYHGVFEDTFAASLTGLAYCRRLIVVEGALTHSFCAAPGIARKVEGRTNIILICK